MGCQDRQEQSQGQASKPGSASNGMCGVRVWECNLKSGDISKLEKVNLILGKPRRVSNKNDQRHRRCPSLLAPDKKVGKNVRGEKRRARRARLPTAVAKGLSRASESAPQRGAEQATITVVRELRRPPRSNAKHCSTAQPSVVGVDPRMWGVPRRSGLGSGGSDESRFEPCFWAKLG